MANCKALTGSAVKGLIFTALTTATKLPVILSISRTRCDGSQVLTSDSVGQNHITSYHSIVNNWNALSEKLCGMQ